MAQHDYVIANGSGATVRADINSALAAIASTNKGPTAPPAPTAGMIWVDDNTPSSSEWTVFIYDGTDWISIGTVNTTTNVYTPAATAVGALLIRAASAAAGRDALGIETMNDFVQSLAAAPSTRTGAYTLTTSDLGVPQLFNISANATFTLPALSGVTAGSTVKVRNLQSSTAWVTIDPNASETINGQTTYLLFPGESVELMATASGWLALGQADFGWRRIARTVASAAAQVDFVLPAGMTRFKLELDSVRPATDNVQLWIRTSTDGGASFAAGASDYTVAVIAGDTTGAIGAAATAAQIAFQPAIDTTTAGHSVIASLELHPGDGTIFPMITGTFGAQREAASLETRNVSGRRNAGTAINAIRFLASSGNLSGNFTLLGRL